MTKSTTLYCGYKIGGREGIKMPLVRDTFDFELVYAR